MNELKIKCKSCIMWSYYDCYLYQLDGGCMNTKILLLFSALTACTGQVLFKKGMLVLGEQSFSSGLSAALKTIVQMVFSPVIFIGLVFYCISTIIWLIALSRMPLNHAYPFTALTFIFVMASSWLVFSETLPMNRIIGGLIVCVGIIVCSFK